MTTYIYIYIYIYIDEYTKHICTFLRNIYPHFLFVFWCETNFLLKRSLLLHNHISMYQPKKNTFWNTPQICKPTLPLAHHFVIRGRRRREIYFFFKEMAVETRLFVSYTISTWYKNWFTHRSRRSLRICSVKTMFLKLLQNSEDTTCARASFFIKSTGKRDSGTNVF